MNQVLRNICFFANLCDKDVIASGGADKHVIIWDMEDDKLKPRVKYPHNSTVQKAKFSPLGNARLVSVATTDFGLFSPDSKDVSKTSFSSRITDIAWAPLGDKFVIVSQVLFEPFFSFEN